MVLTAATLLVVGCAAPAAAPPLAAAAAAATPQGPPPIRFETHALASLQRAAQAQGWVFLETKFDGQSGVEAVYLTHPSDHVREGSLARVKVWTAYAQASPARKALALKTMVQIDCDGNTWQVLSGDAYADQAATVRAGSAGAMGQAEAINPNSFVDNLSSKACADKPSPRTPRRASSGSGVVIAPGVVLTNNHVVTHCGAVEVEAGGKRWPATLRKRDPFRDLALLDASALADVNPPALRTQAVVGERVLVAGFPRSTLPTTPLAISEGTVTALVGLAGDAAHLQMSAVTQPGNSGGPVLDSRGHMIGIAVAGLKDRLAPALAGDVPQDTRFAIQPETVRAFLASENLPLRQPLASTALSPQAITAVAGAFTLRIHCKA